MCFRHVFDTLVCLRGSSQHPPDVVAIVTITSHMASHFRCTKTFFSISSGGSRGGVGGLGLCPGRNFVKGAVLLASRALEKKKIIQKVFNIYHITV